MLKIKKPVVIAKETLLPGDHIRLPRIICYDIDKYQRQVASKFKWDRYWLAEYVENTLQIPCRRTPLEILDYLQGVAPFTMLTIQNARPEIIKIEERRRAKEMIPDMATPENDPLAALLAQQLSSEG